MKTKPITRKDIMKRGLTDRALLYVIEIAESRVALLRPEIVAQSKDFLPTGEEATKAVEDAIR